MGEIPAGEITSGNVIRHFYTTDFGLHVIDGQVKEVSEHTLTGGQEYVRVVLNEARCADLQITAPKGAYLYGREGMAMPTYSFGLLKTAKVRLLCHSTSVLLSSEHDPDAVPLKSLWVWSPGDGSKEPLVTVENYFENADGTWIRFTDEGGSEWVLEPEAFLEQCRFLQMDGPGDSIEEIAREVVQGSEWFYSEPEDVEDDVEMDRVRVLRIEHDLHGDPKCMTRMVVARVITPGHFVGDIREPFEDFVKKIARLDS